MINRRELTDSFDGIVKQWDKDIEGLEQVLDSVKDDMQEEYKEQIDILKEQKESVQKNLKKLQKQLY